MSKFGSAHHLTPEQRVSRMTDVRFPNRAALHLDTKLEVEKYMEPRPVNRRESPHLRCGLCDEPFEVGERTVYVDDERCHRACAKDMAA